MYVFIVVVLYGKYKKLNLIPSSLSTDDARRDENEFNLS